MTDFSPPKPKIENKDKTITTKGVIKTSLRKKIG